MNKRPVILDGAIGTSLWNKAEELGYPKDPVWIYNMEHPDIVSELAKEYADAGSEIVFANTFGANRLSVTRSSSYTSPQVTAKAVEIARNALAGTGCKTALDAGPLSVLLEPYGDLEEDECRDIYDEMIGAGVEAGAELIVLETFLDLEMMKVAASAALEYNIPVLCAMTFEKSGFTMMGNSVDDVIRELEPMGVAGIGMNCSLGPDMALPIIREFASKTGLPLIFKPNAGLPSAVDGTVISALDAETFAKAVEPAFDIVSYIGGCCGSDPSYIREIKKLL